MESTLQSKEEEELVVESKLSLGVASWLYYWLFCHGKVYILRRVSWKGQTKETFTVWGKVFQFLRA